MKTFFLLMLSAAPAAAQDYVDQWFDRVNRDTQSWQRPLARSSGQPYYAIGVIGSYDTNLHLSESDEQRESLATIFVRTRMEYADAKSDGVMDMLASWNQYIPDKEFSDDEERLYFRMRYLDPKGSIELIEVFRHESDPLDVQYADFAERYVSTTIPRVAFDVAGGFGTEFAIQFGYVTFLEDALKIQDNWNLRADLSLVAHLTQTFDAVAQGGWMKIQYTENDFDVPGVDGWYARGGVRGELWKGFILTLLGGVVKAESDEFADGTTQEEQTADLSGHIQWDISQRLTLYADYTRQIAFLGVGGDPFEIINRAILSVESPLTPQWSLKVRAEYDLAESSLGLERTWMQGGLSIGYKGAEKWAAEVGVVWRRTESGEPVDTEADGWIFSLALIATN